MAQTVAERVPHDPDALARRRGCVLPCGARFRAPPPPLHRNRPTRAPANRGAPSSVARPGAQLTAAAPASAPRRQARRAHATSVTAGAVRARWLTAGRAFSAAAPAAAPAWAAAAGERGQHEAAVRLPDAPGRPPTLWRERHPACTPGDAPRGPHARQTPATSRHPCCTPPRPQCAVCVVCRDSPGMCYPVWLPAAPSPYRRSTQRRPRADSTSSTSSRQRRLRACSSSTRGLPARSPPQAQSCWMFKRQHPSVSVRP